MKELFEVIKALKAKRRLIYTLESVPLFSKEEIKEFMDEEGYDLIYETYNDETIIRVKSKDCEVEFPDSEESESNYPPSIFSITIDIPSYDFMDNFIWRARRAIERDRSIEDKFKFYIERLKYEK